MISVGVSRGTAPLESIEEADLPSNDYTGIGGQLLGSLLAPQLDLVAGGQINMTSGVGRLQLHSLGADTQVHLRELPSTFIANTSNSETPFTLITNTTITSSTGSTSFGSGATAAGNASSVAGLAIGGLIGSLSSLINNPGGVGLISNGASLSVNTTTVVTGGNGNPVAIPPGEQPVQVPAPVGSVAPTTYTFAGVTRTYTNDPNLGGTTLASVSGQFAPTANLITVPNPANPGPSPQPPGILVQLTSVNASGGEIGDSQIYGYDPTANALVRFDADTGQLLGTIAVGGAPTNAAGVGLGRFGREEVVLLGRGTLVQAFDASTGAAVGYFTTNNLASLGFNGVDGIGFTGTVTTLSDSTASVPVQAQGTTDFGIQIGIDVTSSINTQMAQPLGSKPFVSDNGFSFSGGTTGIPGTNNIYNFGAAIFDNFQSPFRQAGDPDHYTGYFTERPKETARTVLPNPSNAQGTTADLNFGGTGGPLTGTGPALGSIEQLLAIDQGVANGVNVVRLYVPGTLTSAGSVNLQDPNPIVSLSTTFHPELTGSALVDVQGNIQTFSARTARGLALNDNGNLDLLQINNAANSTVVAQPLSHVSIGRRNDVVLVTPNRAVEDRAGVIVLPELRPLGPLTLPE